MDRHKYVAELAKLLSGMAAADREAVLRGVNRRFDEGENDAAVIASLGSPTFAAVSVLRGYVPPEEDELRDEPEAGPAVVEPVEVEPTEAESAPEEDMPAETDTEPEPGAGEQETSDEAPGEMPGEPIEPETPEMIEPETSEAEAPDEPAGPESTEAEAVTEVEAETDTGDEAEAEPADEAAEDTPAEELETVDADIAEPLEEPAEAADEAAEETGAGETEEPSELPPFWGGPPELPKPPKAKVGLLIVYIFFGIVIGIPVTALLTAVALAILGAGAAVIGAAALLVSFCFLGMSVVADILLLAGAGLVFAALGLLLVCAAIWFFRRCAVGFADLVIRKGRDWCYEHGEEERG